jgi:hypothetical protein
MVLPQERHTRAGVLPGNWGACSIAGVVGMQLDFDIATPQVQTDHRYRLIQISETCISVATSPVCLLLVL